MDDEAYTTTMAAEEIQFEMGSETYFTELILSRGYIAPPSPPPPPPPPAPSSVVTTTVEQMYPSFSMSKFKFGNTTYTLEDICKDFYKADPYGDDFLDPVIISIINHHISKNGITDFEELRRLAKKEMARLKNLHYLTSQPCRSLSEFTDDPDFMEIYTLLDTELLNHSLFVLFRNPDKDHQLILPNSGLRLGLRLNIYDRSKVLLKRNIEYASLELFDMKLPKFYKPIHLQQLYNHLKFIVQWGINHGVSVFIKKNLSGSPFIKIFQRAGLKPCPLKNIMVLFVEESKLNFIDFSRFSKRMLASLIISSSSTSASSAATSASSTA